MDVIAPISIYLHFYIYTECYSYLHHAFKPGSNESPRTHAKNVFFSQSQNKLTQHKSKSLTNLNSVDLSTCLEWLALEKENNLPNFHIQWFDPSDASSFSNNDSFIMEQMKNSEEEELQRMPLYPLNACYIPSLSHQILNNIQPRNICMAQVRSFLFAIISITMSLFSRYGNFLNYMHW